MTPSKYQFLMDFSSKIAIHLFSRYLFFPRFWLGCRNLDQWPDFLLRTEQPTLRVTARTSNHPWWQLYFCLGPFLRMASRSSSSAPFSLSMAVRPGLRSKQAPFSLTICFTRAGAMMPPSRRPITWYSCSAPSRHDGAGGVALGSDGEGAGLIEGAGRVGAALIPSGKLIAGRAGIVSSSIFASTRVITRLGEVA